MGGRSRNSRKKYRKTKPQRILIRCGFLVGAGGLREPRRKGTRVAAPSGCIVPWAARASCWPQPQQLLPVSAAGSGRRCCTGAFLPAGLFGGSMLFESTLAAPFSRQIKQKLRYPLDTGVLGGRGWIARAAHLKMPRRGFFTRRTIRRVDAVRIHPCSPFFKADKTETPVPGSDTGVLGGRGWIRTTEAESSRFTVCPHWPLGNTPIFSCCASVHRTTCLF